MVHADSDIIKAESPRQLGQKKLPAEAPPLSFEVNNHSHLIVHHLDHEGKVFMPGQWEPW
jgi:hypothetical protein